MSEQENIQIAKKQIAALNARNVDEYLSRVDECCREGMRKSLEVLFAAFPDVRLEIEQIRASEDFAVFPANVYGVYAEIASSRSYFCFFTHLALVSAGSPIHSSKASSASSRSNQRENPIASMPTRTRIPLSCKSR